MISFLNGICAEIEPDRVVLDVGGVGYELLISASTFEGLPGIGEPCLLHTYMSVREDAVVLLGFLTREELSFFKRLITVSGIGPKGALSILGAMTVDDLRFAILTGNAAAISRAPGVGKKTAERLVLELKDKLSAEDIPPAAGGGELAMQTGALSGPQEEALEALVSLGYPAAQAQRAVRAAIKENPEADTNALLKLALKEI